MNENQENSQLIFKYFKPDENILFNELKGNDLLELIVLINHYYLELRNNINLDSNITFGIELEVENTNFDLIKSKLSKFIGKLQWMVSHDGTLIAGAEINSPILKDEEKSWQQLDEVCDIVKPLAQIGPNSGGHIHVGTHALGEESRAWLNFLNLWSVYENIIYRFSYGEYLTGRASLKEYAIPAAIKFDQLYQDLSKKDLTTEQIINKILRDINRDFAVNIRNVKTDFLNTYIPKNTIEFRCPNSSLDVIIWQNNINLLTKLLVYCQSKDFNQDIVQKRYQIIYDDMAQLKWYDEIYLDQALEFSDLIFTNNLDKIYFLKQYLKSFATEQPTLTKK